MNIKKVLNEGGIGKIKNGFTLIELLIVIGILALLASVVIVALNPLQNLARTRDSGRLNTVGQLGHALESYATSHDGTYVNLNGTCDSAGHNTWMNCLTTTGSGDLTVAPAAINYSISGTAKCSFNGGGSSTTRSEQNGYCYVSGATGAGPIIVYTRAEAQANISKCVTPNTAAWLVYSSADGKAGVVCTVDAATEPTAGSQTFQ